MSVPQKTKKTMSAFKEFFSNNGSTIGNVVSSNVNGLFSLLGQRRQFNFQKKLNEQQQELALEQMRQSQNYNLANMATQNQYAIDAEKRAQEWNDIGAQASRARAAGISPLAALGSSSGGVLSQSSSPSSSTPSPSGANAGGVGSVGSLGLNLSQTIAQDKHLENETKLADAQVEKMRQETIAQQFENQIRPMLNELKLDDIETQKIKNSVVRAINSGATDSLAYKQAMEELENLVKDTSVKEEIKNLTNAQIESERSRKTELDTSSQLNEARIRQVTAEAGLTEAEAYHLAQYYSTPDAPPWTALSGLIKRCVDDGQKGINKLIDKLKSGSNADKKLGTFIQNLPDKKQKRFIDAMVKASENYD